MVSDGYPAQGLNPSASSILGWSRQLALRRSEERCHSLVDHLDDGHLDIFSAVMGRELLEDQFKRARRKREAIPNRAKAHGYLFEGVRLR
jgi:regulator of sigma D